MPKYLAKRTLGRNGPEAIEGQTVELDEEIAAPLIVAGVLKAIAAPPEIKAPRRAPRRPKPQVEENKDG